MQQPIPTVAPGVCCALETGRERRVAVTAERALLSSTQKPRDDKWICDAVSQTSQDIGAVIHTRKFAAQLFIVVLRTTYDLLDNTTSCLSDRTRFMIQVGELVGVMFVESSL